MNYFVDTNQVKEAEATSIRLRSRVLVDDDPTLIGHVTALMIRSAEHDEIITQVEISYIHHGESKVAWIEPWRLKVVG